LSVITQERAKWAIQTRFNPIRGLKPERLARQLDQYDLGYLREPAILWEEMEARDLLIKNVAAKRRQAVSRAQWEVLTIGSSPEALQQKEALEVFYNNLVATSALKSNLRGGMGVLQRQMMDATGKGFSVHDIAWKPLKGLGTQRSLNRRPKKEKPRRGTGGPAGTMGEPISGGPGFTGGEFLTATFTHVPLQFFENTTGRLRFLESDFALTGAEMKEAEWLVTCADPLMKATSIAYVYKHLPLKFWVGYAEKFGYPGVLAKTNAARDSKEWQEAEAAVASFMNDWGAVVNLETILELVETKGGGASGLPFPALVEYIDRQIAALWRGADLSTISQGNQGVGASLQGEETNLLQEDDAGLITETFWDQIDRLVLQFVLGVTEPLAYVKILPPKKQAVDQDIKIDEFLLKWGVEMSIDDALERYGRGSAEAGDAILQLANPIDPNAPDQTGRPASARRTEELDNSLWARARRFFGLANQVSPEERLRTAKREILRPVMDRLQAIGAMTDRDEQRGALTSLLAEMPRIKARLENEAGDSEVAAILAQEMKDALVKGFQIKRKEKP
jgi:phage gp29-like protein